MQPLMMGTWSSTLVGLPSIRARSGTGASSPAVDDAEITHSVQLENPSRGRGYPRPPKRDNIKTRREEHERTGSGSLSKSVTYDDTEQLCGGITDGGYDEGLGTFDLGAETPAAIQPSTRDPVKWKTSTDGSGTAATRQGMPSVPTTAPSASTSIAAAAVPLFSATLISAATHGNIQIALSLLLM